MRHRRVGGFDRWSSCGRDNLNGNHRTFTIRAYTDIPSFLGAYLHIRFLLPLFGDRCPAKLDLYLSHFFAVGRGQQSIVADPHEGGRQDVYGEQVQELFGMHGHLPVFTAVAVVLPVIGHHPLGSDVPDTGIGNGDTIRVAADVIKYLVHALCRRTAEHDPIF